MLHEDPDRSTLELPILGGYLTSFKIVSGVGWALALISLGGYFLSLPYFSYGLYGAAGLLIFSKILEQRRFGGSIILSPDSIIVKDVQGAKQYTIKDLAELKLAYDGYEGKPTRIIMPGMPQTGQDNYLYFKVGEDQLKYRIHLTRNKMDELRKIIHIWQANGTKVLMTGKYGELL